jgi:GNAT superfamily N-acetyltransferase
MPQIIEVHRDNFTISTDPDRLDVEAIVDMLKRAYWAQGRPRDRTVRALKNSLVFGIYEGEKQIGLARIISDYAVFAYLCDVFIHEDYRANGLGKWLMQTIHSHPDLQGLRRWTLVTRDAHTLYHPFGWAALNNPNGWMEILNPNPGEGRD